VRATWRADLHHAGSGNMHGSMIMQFLAVDDRPAAASGPGSSAPQPMCIFQVVPWYVRLWLHTLRLHIDGQVRRSCSRGLRLGACAERLPVAPCLPCLPPVCPGTACGGATAPRPAARPPGRPPAHPPCPPPPPHALQPAHLDAHLLMRHISLAADRQRPLVLDMCLALPAGARSLTLQADYSKAFLHVFECPPDAHRGFDVPAAIITFPADPPAGGCLLPRRCHGCRQRLATRCLRIQA